jgi:hypothetical protein
MPPTPPSTANSRFVRRGFKLGAQEDPPLVSRQPAISMLAEDNVRQGFLEQDQYERLLEELPKNLKALFRVWLSHGRAKERAPVPSLGPRRLRG